MMEEDHQQWIAAELEEDPGLGWLLYFEFSDPLNLGFSSADGHKSVMNMQVELKLT